MDPEKTAAGLDESSDRDVNASPPDGETSLSSREKQDDVEEGQPQKPQGPPPGAFDPRQNPDGGTKAWLCALGGFCTLFCSFGWINCELSPLREQTTALLRYVLMFKFDLGIGVFQEYYQQGPLSSYAPSTVAWIASLEIFFMFFFGPIIGGHSEPDQQHIQNS